MGKHVDSMNHVRTCDNNIYWKHCRNDDGDRINIIALIRNPGNTRILTTTAEKRSMLIKQTGNSDMTIAETGNTAMSMAKLAKFTAALATYWKPLILLPKEPHMNI